MNNDEYCFSYDWQVLKVQHLIAAGKEPYFCHSRCSMAPIGFESDYASVLVWLDYFKLTWVMSRCGWHPDHLKTSCSFLEHGWQTYHRIRSRFSGCLPHISPNLHQYTPYCLHHHHHLLNYHHASSLHHPHFPNNTPTIFEFSWPVSWGRSSDHKPFKARSAVPWTPKTTAFSNASENSPKGKGVKQKVDFFSVIFFFLKIFSSFIRIVYYIWNGQVQSSTDLPICVSLVKLVNFIWTHRTDLRKPKVSHVRPYLRLPKKIFRVCINAMASI